MSKKSKPSAPTQIGATRMIDGMKHTLMLWLVVRRRADDHPEIFRLCQDGETIEQVLQAVGLPTDGSHKPTMYLLWTPQNLIRQSE